MTVPPLLPWEMDGESRQIQRQMDLSKALRDGVMSWVGFQQNNKHPTIVPTQITATIITGEVTTRGDNLTETKELTIDTIKSKDIQRNRGTDGD